MRIETLTYYNYELGYGFEYFIQNGEIWYKYDDVTYNIKLGYKDYNTERVYENLNDNEKGLFEAKNKYGEYDDTRFINSTAHYRLISRNEEYIKQYRSSILGFEKEKGFITTEDSNSHCVKTIITQLEKAIESDDNEYIKSCSQALLQSPKIQKLKNSKPEKEELIDKISEAIYEYDDIDEVEFTMRKKNNEERKIFYKRCKGQETTCPSWLKDVIR